MPDNIYIMENNDLLGQAIDAIHPPRTHSKQCKRDAITKNPPDSTKNIINCVCNSSNILTRPADFEETCFIFEMANSIYHVSSETILSLKNSVTEVIYPFTKDYDFYRLNYNHVFNFYPVAIVRAHRTNDIVETILFCKKHKLPMRTRAGAHCYQPASLVNFGIVLDLTPRNKIISIDYENSTAKIQSGAILGPVINQLSKTDVAIPFGTCSTNGMAGLTLGGGIGFLLREYGLTSDNVIDMKVVLANGKKIHANKKEHFDLFFALRGAGGGNFGVVTDFTYKMIVANWVTIFTMNFNFDDTKEVFQTWQSWAPYVDTKLTSELDVNNRFQPVIVTGQLLPGKNPKSDQKLLFKLLQPLISLGLHTELSIKTMNLKGAAEYFAQGTYARPFFFYNLSDFNFKILP